MPEDEPREPKAHALREQGGLHRRPQDVSDPLFEQSDFFDPRDVVQVKYEMLRRVRVEKEPVTRAAADFGFSRPSFYEAQAAFERSGLPGLIPRKRGPRGAHKLTEEVMDFVASVLEEEPRLRPAQLAARIQQRFGLQIHPRTIERRLSQPEKKRQRVPAQSTPKGEQD